MIKKIFDYLDKIQNKLELRKWNNVVKKICKANRIIMKFCDMYLRIQKEILDEINNKKIKHSEPLYSEILLARLYELNKEFPSLINSEYYHSANALTRQVIEIYIQMLYSRHKPEYRKKLLEDSEEEFSNKRMMIETLKKSNIDISYVKELSKENWLDSIYTKFKIFSDRFHASPRGLADNIWVWDDEKNTTTLYIKSHKDIGKKKIMIFPKGVPPNSEMIKMTIHEFYTHSGLVLSELKLLQFQTSN